VDKGGFGFMFKWNMGWMNDALALHRTLSPLPPLDHGELTHTADYAFLETLFCPSPTTRWYI
jgi:1,4-alpha-glucan branching enzyme